MLQAHTLTVVLGDIVLLAFEKILNLFLGTEKLHFYNCTNFCLQLHKIFYNCTICAQLHTKKTLHKVTQSSGTPNRLLIYENSLSDIMTWRNQLRDCECVIAGDFNYDLDGCDAISRLIQDFINTQWLIYTL